MAKRFVKPLWNVRVDSVKRTTLGVELVERRWATGRGYLVTADDVKEARSIVRKHEFGSRHPADVPSYDRVQLVDCGHAIVLMDAPRW
jgi:hypothetical protein